MIILLVFFTKEDLTSIPSFYVPIPLTDIKFTLQEAHAKLSASIQLEHQGQMGGQYYP